jgi:mRNA-degrading endonuclease RelE of RelBE toxin-antitoxin system
MSFTLSKISKNVRKDRNTKKGLEKLKTQLKKGEFKKGRGAKKLAGTDSIYYMRSGDEARLFFTDLETERNTIKTTKSAHPFRVYSKWTCTGINKIFVFRDSRIPWKVSYRRFKTTS